MKTKTYHRSMSEFVARIHSAAAAYGIRNFHLFGQGRYAAMLRMANDGYSPAQIALRLPRP